LIWPAISKAEKLTSRSKNQEVIFCVLLRDAEQKNTKKATPIMMWLKGFKRKTSPCRKKNHRVTLTSVHLGR